MEPQFRFIDLFAGIGGIRLAFENIGGQCVFTSEWDKACQETYRANFECNHEIAGDIRDFTGRLNDIPKHDILLAGFPCQPFSLAGIPSRKKYGKKSGFSCQEQGGLFFEIVRILEFHRPPAFLLENVKNLFNHDSGKTFNIIRRTLEDDLGYKVCYRVINARHWVPQNRERIFIAGFRENTGFSFNDLAIPDAHPRISSILHRADETDEAPYFENGHVGEKYTLSPRLWEYLQNYREKHKTRGNGFGYGLVGPDDIARTLSARYYKDGSEILVAEKETRPRRLTPRECARLMGFDRKESNRFVIPVSDTQAYKQFGNSVVVPVVSAVASLMKPHILSVMKKPC